MSGLSLQVVVELRVVFLKIGEIDTLKEQYSADTFIQAKWREPNLDGKPLEVGLVIYNNIKPTPMNHEKCQTLRDKAALLWIQICASKPGLKKVDVSKRAGDLIWHSIS